MSDRASSLSSEGAQSPSRRPNPRLTTADDDPQYHFDSLQEEQVGVAAAAAASAPHTTTRRRSSRTTLGTKGSPRSASPLPPTPQSYSEEQNEGDKKTNKAARKTLKKLLRRDSHHADLAPGPSQSGHEDVDEEESTVGYIPRLGQIRERKSTMQSRRRGSSVISSSGQPRALRRRHTDDSAASRIRVQRRHGSSHRHGEKLAQPSEPLSASSLSQQSSASSSGSNFTVTQKSREDGDCTFPYETFGERQRLAIQSSKMKADVESDVFKYLQSDDGAESLVCEGSQVTSLSSSASLPLPLVTTDPQKTIGSNIPLQALAQQPSGPVPHLPHQEFRKFKKPLYASSFVHGPTDDDDDDETVNQSAESEGSETEGKEEVKERGEPPKVETKAPSPRPQSTSSRGSDLHVRRLKQQEGELANHILQNPKPQKQFQFGPGMPGQPYPRAPMYSRQVYSASPSVEGGATGNPPRGWPPRHTFPAPLAIGYGPHQSPEAAPAYAHSMVRQMPPPLSPHGSQPPHSQQRAPAPSQAKDAMSGYELLAKALSAPWQDEGRREAEIVPVYRKFEHLNHRVLLHLQDEMCELEEELRNLDRCIAHLSPKDGTGHAYPASRRNDARYGGDLHLKRTQVLGRIFQKLEQYNQALSSFSQVSRNLVPAQADEMTRYREWMDEHEAIDYAERQFLEWGADLVAIGRKDAATVSTGKGGEQHHSAAVWFPLLLVVPLMAFAIVPSLLGRVVVIVAVVGVELKLVASAPELKGFLSGQEWTAAVSV